MIFVEMVQVEYQNNETADVFKTVVNLIILLHPLQNPDRIILTMTGTSHGSVLALHHGPSIARHRLYAGRHAHKYNLSSVYSAV